MPQGEIPKLRGGALVVVPISVDSPHASSFVAAGITIAVALHGAHGGVAKGEVRQSLRRIHHLLGLEEAGGGGGGEKEYRCYMRHSMTSRDIILV